MDKSNPNPNILSIVKSVHNKLFLLTVMIRLFIILNYFKSNSATKSSSTRQPLLNENQSEKINQIKSNLHTKGYSLTLKFI